MERMDLLSPKEPSLGQPGTREEHAPRETIRDSESMSTFPMSRTYSTIIENDVEECCGETPRAVGDHLECQFTVALDEEARADKQHKKKSIKPHMSPLSPKPRLKKIHAGAKDRLAKKLRIRTT